MGARPQLIRRVVRRMAPGFRGLVALTLLASTIGAGAASAQVPLSATDRAIIAVIDTVRTRYPSSWLADSGGICVGLEYADSVYRWDPSDEVLAQYRGDHSPVWPYSACHKQLKDGGVLGRDPDGLRAEVSLVIEVRPLHLRSGGMDSVTAFWELPMGRFCGIEKGTFFFITERIPVIDSARIVQLCM